MDGPLARAVRSGGICYLDEIVEARKDTTVVIHPLADSRRILPMEKRGELLRAPAEFMLILSYNPGYQSVLKELKHWTRQRFVAIEFDYPRADLEARIVVTRNRHRKFHGRAPGEIRRDDAEPQGQRPRTKAQARACWCTRRS